MYLPLLLFGSTVLACGVFANTEGCNWCKPWQITCLFMFQQQEPCSRKTFYRNFLSQGKKSRYVSLCVHWHIHMYAPFYFVTSRFIFTELCMNGTSLGGHPNLIHFNFLRTVIITAWKIQTWEVEMILALLRSWNFLL